MKTISVIVLLCLFFTSVDAQNHPEVNCCQIEDLKVEFVRPGYPVYQQYPSWNGLGYTEKLKISAAASNIVEVRLSLIDLDIKYDYENCTSCMNTPLTYGSLSARDLGGMVPSNVEVHPFSTPPSSLYTPDKNPREIVWKYNTPTIQTFDLSSGLEAEIEIGLPFPTAIPCCEMYADACLKVTIIDENCRVCEKIVCGQIEDLKDNCCEPSADCCNPFDGFTYEPPAQFISPSYLDGKNDVWQLQDFKNPDCAFNAQGYEVKVFNRWGNVVCQKSEHYDYCCPFKSPVDQNDPTISSISWDGKANKNVWRGRWFWRKQVATAGKLLPSGTYWMIWTLYACDKQHVYEYPRDAGVNRFYITVQ